MNETVYQFRMYICEILLSVIINIVPKERGGINLVKFIKRYADGCTKTVEPTAPWPRE